MASLFASTIVVFAMMSASMAALAECQPDHIDTAAEKVRAARAELLALRLPEDDIGYDISADAARAIARMKDALSEAIDDALSCQPVSPEAAPALQRTLEQKFGNADSAQSASVKDQPPYGGNLNVHVSALQTSPSLVLAVQTGFDVTCGDDNQLQLYEARDGGWQRVLQWQSPSYKELSGAFGDFFSYVLLPASDPEDWLVIIAHGHPWCTSRWSGFNADLLRPQSANRPQEHLAQITESYVRDGLPKLHRTADGFELRTVAGSLDAGLMTRTVIYRYRIAGNALQRIQPVANNGRDFVDSWLQAPWSDAAHWSAPHNLDGLSQVHQQIEASLKDIKSTVMYSYGAVRACHGTAEQYQVEVDVATAAGQQERSHYFFRLRQEPNGFTMLDATHTPANDCGGPNIMEKR